MTRQLIPSPIPSEQGSDPLVDFPDDVVRLVAATKAEGYVVTPAHAAELWRRHSDTLCATWLSLAGEADADIVRWLLRHAHVVEVSDNPPAPPKG